MEQLKQLTKREYEILQLISEEYSAIEIASLLFISKHTVISHKKNLMLKLNAKNGAGMVRKGFEQGYLQLTNANNQIKNIKSPLRSVG